MAGASTAYRISYALAGQCMRSTQDLIRTLQLYTEDWDVATDADLKVSSDRVICVLLYAYVHLDRRT